MSAFIVNKSHIDAMVTLAIRGPMGEPYWEPYYEDKADELGTMLYAENLASIRARYLDSWGEVIPEYKWQQVYPAPTVLEGFKLISCYEYQSCEHAGWEFSNAKSFCEELRSALTHSLPGWNEAKGWDSVWNYKEVTGE